MTRGLTIGLSLAALCGVATLAHARPPTVMNNPGYERRLQESRSQLGSSPAVDMPAAAAPAPKRSKKKRAN